MRDLKLLSIVAALIAAVSASAASANMPPDPDDEPEASDGNKGGNAIDKATEAGTGLPMTGAGSLPPEGYAIIGDFLASMASGDGWAAVDVINEAWKQPQDDAASPFGWLAPADGPAESVLDQIDESQAPLPMVGEAGSQVAVSGAEPTPPPESILDYLDSAPTPAGAQDATKPAANQAPRPAVQAPRP